MAMEIPTRQVARPGLGFAYLMTGTALAGIVVSGLVGSIFVPNMVTGVEHQHTPIAAFIGWIWNLIAIGLVVPAALQGIHAKVTDRAPWIMLGLGVGGIWLAVMFVAIFAPVWVIGTDPEQLPIWALFAAIAGDVLTGILCNFVKTASFQPAEQMAASAATAPTVVPGSAPNDATATLGRLAELRDSGAITEAEFQAKKSDLLARI